MHATQSFNMSDDVDIYKLEADILRRQSVNSGNYPTFEVELFQKLSPSYILISYIVHTFFHILFFTETNVKQLVTLYV